MNPLPQHRALLGIDVIGSAGNDGHYLNSLQAATDAMIRVALVEAGIAASHVMDWESTGDGALVTLPSSDLGALFDAATQLEVLAARHNRWRKPEVRLRVAVHVGPVGDEPGYYEPKITHARLLNAGVFKQIVGQCLAGRPDGSVNTGLIVSDDAFRAVFGGDHTRLVAKSEFASIPVREKEFDQRAWIRVPGFEARSLAEFSTNTPATKPVSPHPAIHNIVNGEVRGIQAGVIYGNATFGPGTP